MGRAPCCDKSGLKKGPWTAEEDQKLIDYIQKHGHGSWRTLPKNAGLARCGKSCRLRWTNYLRPDIKRGRFSFEEEDTIIQLHSILGNKWSAIAARLPGRTDNEIKNYWNTHIRKRLLRMGIDPVTHSPRLDLLDLSSLLGGIEPLLNSELLRVATNLLSNQNQCQEYQSNNNIQPYQGTASCTQFQPTHDHHQTSMWCNNFSENYIAPAATNKAGYENPEQSLHHFVSGVDDSNLYLPNFESYNNLTTASVDLSTPASSPTTQLNSSTTAYFNSGGTELDDQDSYCSQVLLKFQVPDLLDVSDDVFM